MDPSPAGDSFAVLVRWMGIVDANSAGIVHGGTVMKLADEAAGLAAIRHSRQPVVTAGVDRMAFLHPVHIGDLLTLHAQVNAVWHTSMEVGVRVEAEDPRTRAVVHTNSAYFTMVALDDDGRPVSVRPLIAPGPVEQRRLREAQLRRRNRLAERAQILHVRDVPVDHHSGTPPPVGEHAGNGSE